MSLAAATAGLKKFVITREDVHVRTRPELVFLPPLGGLSDQSDGAVDTLEVSRQSDLVALSSATDRICNNDQLFHRPWPGLAWSDYNFSSDQNLLDLICNI